MSSNAAMVAAWRKRVQGTEPPQHGTVHAYNAYGCRCGECRAAAATKQRRAYALARARALYERGVE